MSDCRSKRRCCTRVHKRFTASGSRGSAAAPRRAARWQRRSASKSGATSRHPRCHTKTKSAKSTRKMWRGAAATRHAEQPGAQLHYHAKRTTQTPQRNMRRRSGYGSGAAAHASLHPEQPNTQETIDHGNVNGGQMGAIAAPQRLTQRARRPEQPSAPPHEEHYEDGEDKVDVEASAERHTRRPLCPSLTSVASPTLPAS